jgi:type III secretion protein D
MKRIRFLTGAHAGAEVPLSAGKYGIGAQEACDICISDWREDPLTLFVDDADHAFMLPHGSENVDAAGTPVVDFTALRFGDVTLCLGPNDAAWPTDIELLSGMFSPAKKADSPSANRRSLTLAGIVLASTMVASAMGAGAIIAGTQPSEAVGAATNLDALAAQLSASLHAAGLKELNANVTGNTLIVRGMVPSAAQDIAARKLIARVGTLPIQRGYDVAENDVRSMQESLGIVGAQVHYVGNGVFRISGSVPSLDRFRQALTGVRNDFDGNVKRIETAVRELSVPAVTTAYSEMIAIGDVRYIQTPDGVKHVYPSTPHSIN